MHFHKNLNGHFTRSKRFLYLGILLIVSALGFFIGSTIEREFRFFDLLYTLILLLNGSFALGRYKGRILFNKAYITLNDEYLTIKTISTKKTAQWESIESIDFSNQTLNIIPWDKNFQMVNLDYIDKATQSEIQEQISIFAQEKGIRINE